MKRRTAWTMAMAAALLFGTAAATVRGQDEGGDTGGEGGDGGAGGGRSHGRLADDVRVRLTLGDRRTTTPMAKVRVKNRGSNAQQGILVQLFADQEGGTLLWSETVDLGPGRAASFRVHVSPPSDAFSLVATATLDGVADEDPSDNVARIAFGTGGNPGLAVVGAGIFAANCASCHGADARGTSSGPWVRGRGAGDVFEAVREGEDGMPVFPGISWDDARAIAAFLKDPDAVQNPPPPPPPPGQAPTYAGQIKALLDSRCAGCHGGSNASANIRLDTLKGASANAAAALAAVQAGRMPKGGTPLSAGEIQLLADWIAGGKQP